jgi:hypothetical protein
MEMESVEQGLPKAQYLQIPRLGSHLGGAEAVNSDGVRRCVLGTVCGGASTDGQRRNMEEIPLRDLRDPVGIS